jgi:hypothetical protein
MKYIHKCINKADYLDNPKTYPNVSLIDSIKVVLINHNDEILSQYEEE